MVIESLHISRLIAEGLVSVMACLLKMSPELLHKKLPEDLRVLLQTLKGGGYLGEGVCSGF